MHGTNSLTENVFLFEINDNVLVKTHVVLTELTKAS